jgi:hypothetical protein
MKTRVAASGSVAVAAGTALSAAADDGDRTAGGGVGVGVEDAVASCAHTALKHNIIAHAAIDLSMSVPRKSRSE